MADNDYYKYAPGFDTDEGTDDIADYYKYAPTFQEKKPQTEQEYFDQVRARAEEERLAKNEAVRQSNIENRNPVTRGLLSGKDLTQGLTYGAIALAGKAFGSEPLQDWGIEGYNRNMEEASLNPSKVEFSDISGAGDALEYVGYTFGKLLPTIAEGAVGATIGSFAAPGPGTATGAFLGRTIIKKGIQKLAGEILEKSFEKGIAREIALPLAEKEATKIMLRSFGAKAGAMGATWQMEAASNFGEAVDRVGIENASVGAALATAAASAMMEGAGGNIRFIDKFLGADAGKVVRNAIEKGDSHLVARVFKEAAIQAPAEAAQEMGQEFMSLVNIGANDPTFSVFSKDNIPRLVEAGVGGIIGGVGFGGATGLLSKKRATVQARGEELDQLAGSAIEDIQKKPESPNFVLGPGGTPDFVLKDKEDRLPAPYRGGLPDIDVRGLPEAVPIPRYYPQDQIEGGGGLMLPPPEPKGLPAPAVTVTPSGTAVTSETMNKMVNDRLQPQEPLRGGWSAGVVVKKNGEAFKTEKSAETYKRLQKLSGYDIFPVEGGFALRKQETGEQEVANVGQPEMAVDSMAVPEGGVEGEVTQEVGNAPEGQEEVGLTQQNEMPPERKAAVEKKVKLLGSMEAVAKKYNDLTAPVDIYANEVARREFGGAAPVEEVPDVRVEPQGDAEQIDRLATASDVALDKEYKYGLAEPGSFGEAANRSSATYAKRELDRGVTDVDVVAAAIHEGWSETARTFEGQPAEKKKSRLELAATPFDTLPEVEKEKDRVAARAIIAEHAKETHSATQDRQVGETQVQPADLPGVETVTAQETRPERLVSVSEVESVKKKIDSLRAEGHSIIEKVRGTVLKNGVVKGRIGGRKGDILEKKANALFAEANALTDEWYAALKPEEFSPEEFAEARKKGMPVLEDNPPAIDNESLPAQPESPLPVQPAKQLSFFALKKEAKAQGLEVSSKQKNGTYLVKRDGNVELAAKDMADLQNHIIKPKAVTVADPKMEGYVFTNDGTANGKWQTVYLGDKTTIDGAKTAETKGYPLILLKKALKDGTAVPYEQTTPKQEVSKVIENEPTHGVLRLGEQVGTRGSSPIFSPPKLRASMESTLRGMRREIEEGEPGRRIAVDAGDGMGGTQETIGVPSTYPAEYFSNRGITRDKALATIDRYLSGEGITAKEGDVLLDMVSAKRQADADAIRNDRSARAVRAEIEAIDPAIASLLSDDTLEDMAQETVEVLFDSVDDIDFAESQREIALIGMTEEQYSTALIEGGEFAEAIEGNQSEGGQIATGPKKETGSGPGRNSQKQEVIPATKKGEDGKLFATPPKFGRKPKAEGSNVNTEDLPLVAQPMIDADNAKQVEMFGGEGTETKEVIEDFGGRTGSDFSTYTFDSHRDFSEKIANGEVTPEELRQGFDALMSNRDEIKADLTKRFTIPQLKKLTTSFHAKTKSDWVDSLFSRMQMEFVLSDVFSYSGFNKEKAIRDLLETVTPEDIAKNAERIAASRTEWAGRIAGFKKALSNPETLDEFKTFIKAKGAAALSAEQTAVYDELVAEENRTKRQTEREYNATIEGVNVETKMTLVETTHTKKGIPLFVVKLADRVDGDVYKNLVQKAKQLGGWYSSFKSNGAVPGFQFKEKDQAEKFMALREGDVSRADFVEQQVEKKELNAAAKMQEMAATLREKAEATLSQDRKTHTHRMAEQASRAEAGARSDIAFAQTLENLAAAIASGEATHLSGITAKTQVEALDSALFTAKQNYERKNKISYSESQNRTVGLEDIDSAEYRFPTYNITNLRNMSEGIAKVKGGVRLSLRLRKLMNTTIKNESWGEVTKKEDIDLLRDAVSFAKKHMTKEMKYSVDNIAGRLLSYDRLQKMGIPDLPTLRAALREYLNYRGKKPVADKIKQLERDVSLKKIPGFFPTPKTVVEDMIDRADIREGMTVLEPSAGKGNIADAIREAGVEPDVVEFNGDLADLLGTGKGYNLIGRDFLETEGTYDRIVMNPPFENNQDIEHVQHAFTLLNPGGKVVSIMSKGPFFRNNKKSTAFRAWLEENGGTWEDLPEGSFKSSERPTGVATVLVEISKPVDTKYSLKPKLPDTINIDGVERPTTNSEGKPIAQTEEGVRNFYRWFGNSSVIDEQGRPMVVYHGTDQDFNMFDVESLGLNTKADSARKGIFFASSPEVANFYPVYPLSSIWKLSKPVGMTMAELRNLSTLELIERGALTGVAAESHIKFENIKKKVDGITVFSPSMNEKIRLSDLFDSKMANGLGANYDQEVEDDFDVLSHENKKLYEDFKTALTENQRWKDIMDRSLNAKTKSGGDDVFVGKEDLVPLGPNVVPVYLSIKNPLIHNYDGGIYRGESFSGLIDKAKDMGMDGLVLENTKDPYLTNVYVALTPTQIKSAIGNIGTFDPKNTDIRYQTKSDKEEPTKTKTTTKHVESTFPTATKIEHDASDEWRVHMPNGAILTVKAGEYIAIDRISAERAYGNVLDGEIAVGSFEQSGVIDTLGIIRLAKEAESGTINHEHFHAAMAMALSKFQIQVVLKKYGTEEKAAAAYEKWTGEHKNSLFQKILDFFRNLRAKLFTENADDVFRRVKSGKAWGGTKSSGSLVDRVINPSKVKGFPDRMISDAKNLASTVNTISFIEKGLDSLDIPAKLAQLRRVGRLIENDQIRKAVVEAIPVDMVDVFRGLKLSPNMLLHDVPMFRNLLSIDGDNSISLPVDVASRLVNIVAISAAKVSKVFSPNITGTSIESNSTVGALERNNLSPALNGTVEYFSGGGSFVGDALDFTAGTTDNINHREPSLAGKSKTIIPTTEAISTKNIFDDSDVSITAKYALRKKQPDVITETFTQPKHENIITHVLEMFDSAVGLTSKGNRSTTASNLRTALVDRFNPILERLGEEAYRLHRMLNNSAVSLGTFLQHGKLSWDGKALTVKTKNEGFVPWLKSLGEDGHNFLYWVAAKRAEKLDVEGRENWITKDRREKIIKSTTNDGAKTAQFEKWNEKLQEYNKNIIDIAVEAGIIDPESRKRWMSDYYLPFYRVLENEETAEEFLKAPGKSKRFIDARIKQLKGGESILGDPMQNIIHNWAHLITESQRSVARKNAAEVAVPMGFAKVVKASAMANLIGANTEYTVKDDVGDILEVFDKKRDADQYALATGGTVSEKTVLKFGTKEEHAILSYRENGKAVYIQVSDPQLYEALSQVDAKAFDNAFMKVFSGAKRLLTAGATFGAGFRIANALRDTLHTAIVSKSFMPFVDTGKGLVQVWRRSPDYIALMASGGGFSQGYLDSGDPKALSRSIDKIIEREGKGARGRILDGPRALLAFWERIGHASEMAARVQLYTNLRAKGEAHIDASYKGRDLLDFANSGQAHAVRVITALVPFLNARMQGLDRLARGYKEDPRAFLVKGGLLTLASLALWGANKDDDRYKELEDWDKWQYHHFWIGDDHYRIPKAFEVGAIFSTLFEAGADSTMGEEDFGYFVDMLAHTATQTFAIGAPAALLPSLEVFANKSTFTGRAIESAWSKDTPPGLRSKPWTPEILKDLGEVSNISPLKMQHLLRGHLATFATMFFTISDLMYGDGPEQSIPEITGMNRFIKDKPGNTKYATRFYQFSDDLAKMIKTVKYYQGLKDFEKAREVADENQRSLKYRRFVLQVKKQLTLLGRFERGVWDNSALDPKQKREKLDKLRERKNEIYKMAYERIYGKK